MAFEQASCAGAVLVSSRAELRSMQALCIAHTVVPTRHDFNVVLGPKGCPVPQWPICMPTLRRPRAPET
eukprot:359517-Chlamydomonas_euryale.AAC.7